MLDLCWSRRSTLGKFFDTDSAYYLITSHFYSFSVICLFFLLSIIYSSSLCVSLHMSLGCYTKYLKKRRKKRKIVRHLIWLCLHLNLVYKYNLYSVCFAFKLKGKRSLLPSSGIIDVLHLCGGRVKPVVLESVYYGFDRDFNLKSTTPWKHFLS